MILFLQDCQLDMMAWTDVLAGQFQKGQREFKKDQMVYGEVCYDNGGDFADLEFEDGSFSLVVPKTLFVEIEK